MSVRICKDTGYAGQWVTHLLPRLPGQKKTPSLSSWLFSNETEDPSAAAGKGIERRSLFLLVMNKEKASSVLHESSSAHS
jgi:hypothetical protein